jgi:hypothetical protein
MILRNKFIILLLALLAIIVAIINNIAMTRTEVDQQS